MERGWDLEELVRRVALALAAGDVRSANGRVTQLPDRRVTRWYATIGLVDRPLASQGRTARYGPRHLLQLVAIKRRQAEGRSLADIQAELTGATDATLGQIAQVPAELLVESPTQPAKAATTAPAEAVEAIGPADGRALMPDRFWARLPAAATEPGWATEPRATEPAPARDRAPMLPGPATMDGVLHGVRLRDEVVLLLPVAPPAADLAAIRAAAQPLLDLLVHRGLLPNPGGSTT
jgi:DNA-binding transcriptional MerR regulator